jgi:cytochrome P450
MPPMIDLLSPDVRADPFPTYAKMREQWPTCQVQPGGFWAVSRYDDVSRVLRDFRMFSSFGFRQMFEPLWIDYNPLAHSMLAMDPPQHTRLRKFVNREFTASALSLLEPLLHTCIGRFTPELAERDKVDFVATFAAPLQAHVVCIFLGLDPSLSATFNRWAYALAGITPAPLSDEHASRVLTAIEMLQKHFQQVLATRRSNPGDDFVSRLLQIQVEGSSLSDEELIAFLFLLLAAGLDSTIHLLSQSMVVLTDRLDLQDRLRQDESLIPKFIDELVRFEPVAHAVFRQATQDVEVAGTTIPGGSFVMALVASANRDPVRFTDPDTFNVERGSRGGLAFGAGPHMCIGAALARLEAKIALTALLQRFARFERVNEAIDWHHTLVIRGPASLPMRFTPA